jgi:putative transposase
MMNKSNQIYPTSLNDTEWARLEQLLPDPSPTGRPRKYSLREDLDALFYLVKNGCTWRSLPKEFPPWETVYGLLRQLQKEGVWEEINRILREEWRKKLNREPQTSLMILDSQSVKSAEGGCEIGYDGGKKVKGRKRTLIVDSQGALVKAKVGSAARQDVFAGKEVLEALKPQENLLGRLEKIMADAGFRGELVEWVMSNFHVPLEIVKKDKSEKGFTPEKNRWVIERTIAWITRQRRLARDYERRVEVSEAFIYLTMTRLYLKRLKCF